MSHPHVIVFGSINMDLVAKVPRLPVPGETLIGHTFSTVSGGKGANQAVAVARLGIPTFMVGRVGGDDFGQDLLTSLQTNGVQTNGVLVEQSARSGVAMIAVDDQGENHIIVISGVNRRINEEDVERLTHLLPGAAALLLQFEIPLLAVQVAAEAAQKAGVKVILDPAPALTNLPTDLYPLLDIITPNAVEAEQLVGFPVNDLEAAAQAATVLRQRGVDTVVIKLGAQGVFCATADETFFLPAFAVQTIDTVAAGDAFNGGLAVALAEGLSLKRAIVWGAAAGALATTKAGAQTSMPERNIFNAFLQEKQ